MDDAFAAIKWLQAQAMSDNSDLWLTEVCDFSRVFISGNFAGKNLAHYLVVRLGRRSLELARDSGQMLNPFGGLL
ncbi:hypothetical protein K1719_036767 [Acacia pycnantha]|nr:hypothetical protein K1719_036759 [Acacia pycnantha]KAI9081267.1 hypothetical protein K1719_036767 [Acacia pycnantha]